MIKRRRDYEKFCGIRTEWIQLWQVGKNVYRVENVFKKQWWADLRTDWPKDKRLWVFAFTVRNMIKYYSEAPTVEGLAEEALYCDTVMADIRKMMKEQGFYAFFDMCNNESVLSR